MNSYLQKDMNYLIIPDRDTDDTSVTVMKLYKHNTSSDQFEFYSEKAFHGYNNIDQYCFTEDMQFAGYPSDNKVSVSTGINEGTQTIFQEFDGIHNSNCAFSEDH